YARLAALKGPDRRLDIMKWVCAHHAWALVQAYAARPPVKTQDGSVLRVAQLLFEAVEGKAPSETGLLQSVRKVAKWNDDGEDAYRYAPTLWLIPPPTPRLRTHTPRKRPRSVQRRRAE